MVTYQFMFQTSGFERVDNIRAEVESQRDWDYVPSFQVGTNIQLGAAARYGFLAPFTEEQKALARYLRQENAGPNISTYAWGLLAEALKVDLNSSDLNDFDTIDQVFA